MGQPSTDCVARRRAMGCWRGLVSMCGAGVYHFNLDTKQGRSRWFVVAEGEGGLKCWVPCKVS